MSKILNWEEISKHNKRKDAWIVINDKVYNITKFLPLHPGGEEIIMQYAGKDGTKPFKNMFHSERAVQTLENYFIGYLAKVGQNDENLDNVDEQSKEWKEQQLNENVNGQEKEGEGEERREEDIEEKKKSKLCSLL